MSRTQSVITTLAAAVTIAVTLTSCGTGNSNGTTKTDQEWFHQVAVMFHDNPSSTTSLDRMCALPKDQREHVAHTAAATSYHTPEEQTAYAKALIEYGELYCDTMRVVTNDTP